MLKFFPFIARNAVRNRRRSILTVLSVTISLCLLGVLLCMYRGLFYPEDTSPEQARRLVVHHRVSLAQPLYASYKSKIAHQDNIRAVTTWQWFGGTYKEAGKAKYFFAQLGVDPEDFYAVRPDVNLTAAEKKTFKDSPSSCIASKELADSLGWKVGEKIPLIGTIFNVNLDLTLIAIFTDADHGKVLFYNDYYLQQLLRDKAGLHDTVGAYLVLVDTPEHVTAVGRAIDETFANTSAPTKSESEKDFARSFLAFLGNIQMFLAAISGAVMFTILLVSANTVAMTVRERIRETAILRTLGFTPGEVRGLILGEAAFLSFIGGALGGLLAGLASFGLHNSGSDFRLPVLTPAMVLSVVCVGVVIGVVSAAFPAWFASRRPIVESMRYSG